MGKSIDLTGQEINMLILLERKVIKDDKGRYRTYYLCCCKNCGNQKLILADHILSGKHKACGCLVESNQFKIKDITNMKFGRLTAIKSTDERKKQSVVWECKCECGNIVLFSQSELVFSKFKSCGCLKSELAKTKGSEEIKKYHDKVIIDNTNINNIKSLNPQKNNKSTGVRGVSFDKKTNRYMVQIQFKKKHYNLGRYDTIVQASEIYQVAKKKLHGEFLEWYENEYKKGND